jgi:DNA-binding response OmpR family regulator
MTILVVDDDQLILEAIAHKLRNQQIKVITAQNGFDAIQVVQNEHLDLIISDIMMPDMSGLSLMCLVKQYQSAEIPVIIISALDKADVILSSLGLGAEDFISKPIDFDRLSACVNTYAA